MLYTRKNYKSQAVEFSTIIENFPNDKYETYREKDDNIIQKSNTTDILVIFMSDVFFCTCLIKVVLLLLSTILYNYIVIETFMKYRQLSTSLLHLLSM